MADSAATPNDNAQEQKPQRSGKRKLFLLLLLLVVILAGVGVYCYHLFYGRFHASTDDAYVNGNLVQITPQVTGTVTRIAVDDGDFVRQGQPLVEFDPSDTAVAQQSAEANLAKTVRQVRGLFSNVDSYKAQVAARRVEVERARADYARRQQLAKGGAISKEELAHARDTLVAAQSSLTSAQQQLDTNQALVDDTEIASHPDVKAAAAQLRQAYLNHARSTLVAPVSGYVAKRSVQVGSRVQPGAALMAVVPLDQIWIDANFKETQLAEMRIGQPVEIHSDLYGDDVRYRGVVESLGVGTGSAFSLLPAQNATGNWIKIVQRLPVRIRLEGDNLDKHPLRIGLSTVVDVDLHDQDGARLPTTTPQQPRYSTDVYDHQLAEADQLIQQIVHNNGPAARAAGVAKR
ncbi:MULTISPECIES: efflux RND transporter periplasmic adaptor subunit [Pseudomonadaceae]|jgi:membrane fusion protein (multidrug efflux system)|uniref:HlyD family secretion protein n=3 Tax=Pseudomonadaceae TaxID=135621 RepID=A0A1G5NAQ8_9PSED|nr:MULTISPECIES: efflux RND transporter periplasmic adaptor subunit [Pseudomonas]EHK69580.1 hemolysin D [Pseudomonas psychrotolerans L19]KIZ49496.1 hemolysin D [Pseudomonas oryzihabitans]KTT51859.1 hemolysin D [Pseudomonas psychrotolerans]MBA1181733.1 HlyD family efflux transporter periplasmic adaptor subunit [Pseudomonas psychrotolerans]MBA1213432.1 HlyD family efflux transporter periplasmic adaptor subunit [Pseudomonas psychrotolerans]